MERTKSAPATSASSSGAISTPASRARSALASVRPLRLVRTFAPRSTSLAATPEPISPMAITATVTPMRLLPRSSPNP